MVLIHCNFALNKAINTFGVILGEAKLGPGLSNGNLLRCASFYEIESSGSLDKLALICLLVGFHNFAQKSNKK